jgi:isoquinoline 1-oxidoreductase beta subunit
MWDELRVASEGEGIVARREGDARKGLATGSRLDAAFELPLLAHATMEPMNCTVHLRPDGCEVWLGTQVVARVQQSVAAVVGMPVDKVKVHNHLLGGGFGRRLEPDMASIAARVAQHAGAPVKVVWTREEDIRHDYYRPLYRDVVSATLANGRIASCKYKVCGSAILAAGYPGVPEGIDNDAVDSAVDMPYDIPNLEVEYVRVEPKAVRTGFCAGSAATTTSSPSSASSTRWRKRQVRIPSRSGSRCSDKTPRLKSVLQLAATRSGWGRAAAEARRPRYRRAAVVRQLHRHRGRGRGRYQRRSGPAARHLGRRHGIAVHPDTIVAQLQGGLLFGLTAALYGEITVKNGRVEQSNFHDYVRCASTKRRGSTSTSCGAASFRVV